MLENLLPFDSHYLDRSGNKLHYVNEGQGEPVVMVHGNPSWSYYYRNLVSALSTNYQCIVPDHIGCGLSDKPDDPQYDYTLENRIDDLEALLDHLDVKENITLVVHDWGGMIGMGYAARYPERIKRLVFLNTAAFHLPESKPFPWALWVCRETILGTFLVRGFNAFSSIASYVGVKRQPMAKAVREAYVAPFNSWKNRISTLRFVQDIPLKPEDRNYELVSNIADSLSKFSEVPTLICWGLQDFVFDKHFLAKWRQYMPHAQVREFDDCGHYILEDASEDVIGLIQNFMANNQQS
ncbi:MULTISPECIES: alpha/beta fold hydrolase [unclassified Shewanella]|uniref:alpha/beta fold hydrolase n=1 Tax=unclassified Shewanella TaxID=196818 RepID=UPI000C8383C2|nr:MULTISPECIES: alpha/beta fold hydrolase [unclassified Shewanella]MDO6620556.1 alpha/beta fold hydrolase [Shewanella sp. 6_MG-2023]MDO6641489.1 alpha/beta fold hydrolase [Shewanella sp. 5_MG-2023]MDO6680557.1 alpha/beta fold hydrolase [Shewanella sp. 4_MG-2023]PMG28262.1 alpha/beta hydrolase [Shewanella sp. 10N.286.52.C2]PMG40630.1 alpha/beta hydrolase [Shewanella sp. 10N.286.52.B9]